MTPLQQYQSLCARLGDLDMQISRGERLLESLQAERRKVANAAEAVQIAAEVAEDFAKAMRANVKPAPKTEGTYHE